MRGRVLLGIVLLVGAAYFAVFGGDYDVFDLWHVRSQAEVERARTDSMDAADDRARARRDSLATDSATIERLARERYGLIREGEVLYRFSGSPDDSLSLDAVPVDTTGD